MRLKGLFKEGAGRRLAVPAIVCAVIVIVAISTWMAAQRSAVERTFAEKGLAVQYGAVTRSELFDEVLDAGNLSALSILGNELFTAQIAVEARLQLRSRDMSSDWSSLFSYRKSDLGMLLTDRHLRSLSDQFVSSLADCHTLTEEERKVLTALMHVWEQADAYSEAHALQHVLVKQGGGAVSSLGERSHLISVSEIELVKPPADAVAEHGYALIRQLLSLPRMFPGFLDGEGKIEAVSISGGGLCEQYVSENAGSQFSELLRNYSFLRMSDRMEFEPVYRLEIELEDSEGVGIIVEIGSSAVRISFPYEEVPYVKLEGCREEWDEWLYKIKLSGMYSCSPDLVEDILQLVGKTQ